MKIKGLKHNVLIVEENLSLFELLKESPYVEEENVYFPDTRDNILSVIQHKNINIVILDSERKDIRVPSLIKQIKSFDPLVDIIIIGKPLASEKIEELIILGARDYLVKPVEQKKLFRTLEKIHRRKELKKRTFSLEKKLDKKYYFQGIVSKNPAMLEIFNLIEKIAPYYSTVLITGETGTGKELVARAVHKLSPVRNRNMVNFNCNSVPETLFESELFGYLRGAFTGAGKDKKGLFEKAQQGTIFLDEIGEMPFPLQSKLLRVLEYHKLRSLGSTEEKNVDVRIIVSTNRNLKHDVEKGSFREDLFYRLNKLQIHIPPLRRREEDIFLLIRHFIQHFNQKFDKKVNGVSQKVQNLFHDYHWPGNVRELENVLESACMLTKKNFIHLNDLPEEFKKRAASSQKIPVLRSENITSLNELEKEYINYVFHYTRKNIKRTAELLHISRTTLYNKLKKYNIS